MKTNIVKSTTGLILAFALVAAGSAFAADSPQETFNQGDSQEIRRKDRHRPPRRPPQEAIEACEGMCEGDTVQFETPRGHTITGVCKEKNGLLFAVPEGGPPPGTGRRQTSRNQ